MNIKEKFEIISKGTIFRTIALVAAILNEIVAVIGQYSFADATWYQVVSIIVLSVAAIIAAWENNDWTYFARLGTGVLDALEDGKLEADEVRALLERAETKDQTTNQNANNTK